MIETKGLSKNYGTVIGLQDLNLTIERGEIFGYVGRNGAGKTTTIRLLCGLLRPSAGTATVAGEDVVSNPSRLRSLVGYMPDRLACYEGMRVWEYLDFFAAIYRLSRKLRKTRVDEVLELTGSAALKDYFVETLSHGMGQRLGLARALIHDPDVLFLDEPTSGLDPRARVEMRTLMLRLKELGKTILISSHILPELANVCDRVGFMEQGKLVSSGTVEEVRKKVHAFRLFEVELDKDGEAAEATVREQFDSELVHKISRFDNLLRIEMQADDKEASDLLRLLVASGHDVIGFREVTADLEEAFLALTEQGSFGQRVYQPS